MVLDQIKKDISVSLKNGDTVRVDTLRFLVAAVHNTAIAKYGVLADTKLTDEDVLVTIKKQVKTHKESIEAYQNAKRDELAEKEKQELVILEAFLPKQVSDDELKKLLEPVVKSGEKNLGLLMKQAMMIIDGKADGGRVASLLKQMQENES